MAKRETATPPPDDFIARLDAEIRKEYGDGISRSGDEILNEPKEIISVCPSLDAITGGGIEEGSWVGITGGEKLGKTVLALTIAAQAQKQDRFVYYANVENRLSRQHLEGIKDLKTDGKNLKIFGSRKGRILCDLDYLDIFARVLKNHPRCVLIIDSISTLCSERVMNEGAGAETRSSGYKYVSQFIDSMTAVVPINNCIVIGISRMIANTGGGMGGRSEKAPNAWKFQCDYQLKAVMKTVWKTGENTSAIGQDVLWECRHSKTGTPFRKIEAKLRYGVGYDRVYEAIEFGEKLGLVEKSGSWFSLNLDGDSSPSKVQGKEAVYRLLLENPAWAEKLEAEVMRRSRSLFMSVAD